MACPAASQTVDATDRDTPEGARGRRYVREQLAVARTVIVNTRQTDLHGRYVAHLFYAFNNRGIERTFTNGRYLNQELVNTTSPCPPILNKAARSTGAHVCYNRPHEDVLRRSEGRRGGESCRKAAEQ